MIMIEVREVRENRVFGIISTEKKIKIKSF